MSEQHADQGYRKLFQTMAGMSWKERIKYFLYYYGKVTIIGILLLVMLGDILWDSLKEKPEVLYSGLALNVYVSGELESALTEDLLAQLGDPESDNQEVALAPMQFDEYEIQMISTMAQKIAAGSYDYVLLDQASLNQMAPRADFPDLRLFLSEEQLEPWAERFAYGRKQERDYPIAINITGTKLAEGCTYAGEYLYIAFPVTQETAHKIPALYDCLMENLLTVAD